jgi:hypothetical protein
LIFLDGRVTQWLLRKGFESNGTMKENTKEKKNKRFSFSSLQII